MALLRSEGFSKFIADSIHGDIHLNRREVNVIDTASFQRLRRLKQLAMAQMVYPSATHTRFSHSIGALGTIIRIIDRAKENGLDINESEKDDLRLAALLHDVGHYPYSHLMESVDKVTLTEELVGNSKKTFKKEPYPPHEEIGRIIVTSQKDLIAAIGGKERADKIADLFSGSETEPKLSKLIHSSLDLDRMDYLLRDSYATGVPYGHIDINYLLNNLRVSKKGTVGFSIKALSAVEQFLLARFFMYRTVYYHKTIYGMEEACRHLLRRLRDDDNNCGVPVDGNGIREKIKSEDLRGFTDSYIDDVVQKATNHKDKTIQTLALAIQNRRPPQLLKEVPIFVDKKSKYHAGKALLQNFKREIDKISKDIPIGQFIWCETQPKSVFDPPSTLKPGDYQALTKDDLGEMIRDEEEKDIKIFLDKSDNEPKSLMEVEHSLVVKFSQYYFQAYRLYVVYEGKDKDKIISDLRNEVKDWDKG